MIDAFETFLPYFIGRRWQQRASEEFSERILILGERILDLRSRIRKIESTTGMLLIEKIILLNGFRDFEVWLNHGLKFYWIKIQNGLAIWKLWLHWWKRNFNVFLFLSNTTFCRNFFQLESGVSQGPQCWMNSWFMIVLHLDWYPLLSSDPCHLNKVPLIWDAGPLN